MCSIRWFGFKLIGAMLRQGNKGSLLAEQAKASHLGGKAGYPKGAGNSVLLPPQLPLLLNTCSQHNKEELKRR